ncbi:uncharacterized protein M421DRAFT_412907 [Didymella exigua CBS 183.55]|uniref:Uncharacterized protein n=1 Tax=Didymella exigua CBS 183.55 TaxID=1150837 RepID=A0A6A5RT37_9PLEO|nr:uncharacterized protein M421DRAFT_412907 [Didymella exigua CBS 183.55]KAF1930633.1 hypothetical protein M421DRAFT_412907 [Didymella exigua CBS 183.55]
MRFRPALLPLAAAYTDRSRIISPCVQSLCAEAQIPALDLDAAEIPENTSSHGDITSWRSVEHSKDSLDLSRMSSPENRLETDALIDALCVRVKSQGYGVAKSMKKREAHKRDQSDSSIEKNSTSSTVTNDAHADGMVVDHEVDFIIEHLSGSQTKYPVYTCHHTVDTDFMILSRGVLEELEKIVLSQDDKLRMSRLRIIQLEKALRRSDQDRDAATKSMHIAQNAEARAVSTLEVVAQEKNNAQTEIRLLQQALQLAQRGYSDAKEEIRALQKDLDGALADSDRSHERMEALHGVLNANQIEMMNMRKCHEFAKTQSKGYLRAMEHSIECHEAARLQLLEQQIGHGRLAVEKIAQVERRNAELEEMFAVNMHVTQETSRGDLHLEMSAAESSETVVGEDQDEAQRSGWGLGSWRVRNRNGIDDTESGPYLQTEIDTTDEPPNSAQQNMRGSTWGVTSLRLRGVWGGRTQESILPRWATGS